VSDFSSRASLAGAVDLSSLKNRAQAPSTSPGAAAANAQTGQAAQAAETTNPVVPSLVIEGNEANFNGFIGFSNSVPLVVEFYASWSEPSKALSMKLQAQTEAANGRILLIRVDVQAQPKIAAAFKVEGAPTVVAVIKGQPVPLFSGDQDAQAIATVFERILEVAAENQIAGTAVVDPQAAAEAAAPKLSSRHQAAYDAIDRGDYKAAVQEYQAALNEMPSDALAKAGLAQANLLVRTAEVDVDEVLASQPSDLAGVLIKADVLVAVGHAQQGFYLLLSAFEAAAGDVRDEIRKHLLELFEVQGSDSSEVADARKKLALLLY
jgi:putative thioredoxin